jgi:hypothetical protein
MIQFRRPDDHDAAQENQENDNRIDECQPGEQHEIIDHRSYHGIPSQLLFCR